MISGLSCSATRLTLARGPRETDGAHTEKKGHLHKQKSSLQAVVFDPSYRNPLDKRSAARHVGVMNQRFDLIAISFLVFSAMIAVGLATDPKGFSLKEWQPLMASFVALGAASLAYKAAMAKVDYDRARELRELSRKRLRSEAQDQFPG